MLTAFEFEQASTIRARRGSGSRTTGQPTRPDVISTADVPRTMRPVFLIVVPPGLTREWIAACLRKLDGDCRIEFAQASDSPFDLLGEANAGLVFVDLDVPDIDRVGAVRAFSARCQGVPLVVRYSEELSTPRNQAFVSAFRAMRNGENPDQYAQGGYDSVYLQVEAIRRAGGTDPARVREELRKTNYTSISGSAIRFDGNQQATPKLFVAVVKDGKRIIVQEIDTSGIPY